VAAQIDFDGRGEPSKIEAIALGPRREEGRLGEIHLARHQVHPRRITSGGQQAHSGRITGKRLVRERVDLEERKFGRAGSAGHVPRIIAGTQSPPPDRSKLRR
jgi:hypothetical protein